jgi:hypothetical protein
MPEALVIKVQQKRGQILTRSQTYWRKTDWQRQKRRHPRAS